VSVGFCIYPSLDGTGYTYVVSAEQPYAKRRLLSAQGGLDKATLSLDIRPSKFIGRSTESVNYTGSASGNPSIVLYGLQVLEAIDGSTSITVEGEWSVEYTVMFYDRVTLSSS
jgi:hypothetical protein